jgi:hypothetical protein
MQVVVHQAEGRQLELEPLPLSRQPIQVFLAIPSSRKIARRSLQRAIT